MLRRLTSAAILVFTIVKRGKDYFAGGVRCEYGPP